MKRKTRIIAAILLLSVFVLSGCGTRDSFISAVKGGNYAKAIEIYEKKIDGNSKAETEVQDALETYLEQAWDAYVSGSMSGEDFRAAYRCLEKINDRFWILPELMWLAYEYETIEDSKESFAKGMEYAANGNYAEAMEAFDEVIPEDTENYDKAVKEGARAHSNYLESIRQKAEDLANAGSYDDALALIEDAEDVLGDSEELQTLKTDVATRQISEEIERAYREGKLLEVVRLYEEALDDEDVEISFEMTQMYSESRKTYVGVVSKEARAAFENGQDYEAACTIVQKALAEAAFSNALVAELEPMLDEYSSYVPVALTSFEPVRQGDYVMFGDNRTATGTYTDVNGTVYDKYNMIHPYEATYTLRGEEPQNENDSTVAYILNYGYSVFTGTVFRPYGTLSNEDWTGKYGKVKIYGDGVLLYESADINESTWEPDNFKLDVSGVRELRIMICGRWKDGSARWPIAAIANPMLQK